MNAENENKDQPGQKEPFRVQDLSLKGYYTIAIISVIIGFVIVGILNLATPLQIIRDRLAYLSQLSTPLRLLNTIPPVFFLLMVYFAYRMLIRLMLRPVAKYLKIYATGGSLPGDLAEKARRRLLNIPFMFIPLNMAIWIVFPAAIFLGAYLGNQMDLRTAVIIAARTSMVGFISSFIASHRMEAYSRRKLIPFFFPSGRLADVRGTFRISISRRIRLLNRLGNVVPGVILLVTLATLQWEVGGSQISSVEYGWIIIRFSLILCVIFFYMTHVLNRVGSRNITEPIKEILRVIKRIRKGQFDEKVRVVSNDEIGYTGDVINEMTEGLKERDSMKRSLELAMEVQQNLLPKENPRINGLDIAGRSIYCDETGGDYYDFITLNGDGSADIAIVVGDVSGHGIPSALLMATARAFIRLRTSLAGGLAQVISDVNRQIVRDVEETGQFMTLFYLTVDQERRGLEWVRAGHDPGIFYDPATEIFEDLAGPGLALGIDGDWNYESNRKEGLEQGQIIFLGTDGIWEAQNRDGNMFGKEALCKIIRRNADGGANELLDAIIDSLDHFRDGFQLQDDVTLIVVKIGEACN